MNRPRIESIHVCCSRALLLLCLAALAPAGGCSKFDMLNATVGSCGYVRTSDLFYGPLPRQKLDVYRPRGAADGARVVIFFYGGDWQEGDKADYRFAAEALTSQGFIAVLPDYRLYPHVTFPGFVQDGAMAVRWVHDHAASVGGDPTHVYLMGHSAGAHIAALLTLDEHYLKDVGLDRSAIRATAALSGPYNFVPSSYDRAVFSMAAGEKAPDPKMEPIHFVDGYAPPMLLLHGVLDDVVSKDNAIELAEKIRQAGGEAKCILYPDRAHRGVVLALAWPFRWLAPVLRDTADFFRQH